ncbi:tannase/feruloyl esterase family alpha/beta hydrolase [Actinoplanes sp. NPDC049599]|uniref:tannase/feruloyl esterase family alpha/beta hydrolase n=1 Tax=Actinoplanes sp. NPDC049599 TaxID=3363903 RepID=UPI0037A4E3FA
MRPLTLAAGLTLVLTMTLTTGLPASAVPAGAAPPSGLADLPAVAPVLSCADVPGLRLDGVTISSAAVVSTGAPAPYCEVRGTIAPANTIVLRLPVHGWTQRYVQTGCGGLCGTAVINYGQAASCPPIADGTVAGATTDMGHQGRNDGSWAAGNPQAQIDFAYRGVHVTAQVAKAIITAFYGRRPAYSYFTGCSDGGREGLMAAQRYPGDFDGIAAGAPANNMAVQNTFHHAWNVLANKDAAGNFILLAGKLPLVHQAVLAACDRLDGLTDRLLGDPRLCRFDPASIVCRAGQDVTTCLTAAEATVVRRLHDGATDARGRRLEVAVSHEWGSELEWTLFVPAAQGQPVASEMFALSYLRYLAEPNHPRPEYQLSDLAFTVESFWRTVLPSSTYLAAMDPDLRAFQRGGGKLLLWHGWNDQHIAPRSTLAYYDAVRATMGAATTDRFARLYLFPGLAHCGGGAGPDTFDVLTPVMAWVETGRRPGRIAGTSALPVARVDTSWVGQGLYSSGYQTWPRAAGGKLVIPPPRR